MSANNERSTFHRGERAIQERLGVGEKMARMGGRVTRDYMPEQHRHFFERLPFVFYGALDELGQPWAAMLTGEPGFVATPDERSVAMTAQPLAGDPVFSSLRNGSDVGLLGLEFDTRRRNRANGSVNEKGEHTLTLSVKQSFGNCPKYIQNRSFISRGSDDSAASSITCDSLNLDQQRIIEQADTFFIATQFSENGDKANEGVDVSHRGGKPGFVKVESATTLIWPDFIGNNFFNTLGNLMLNPRSGLLFVNFERGDLLYLTGVAEVIWDSNVVNNFEGAQRMIRFEATRIVHAINALPFIWSLHEISPYLEPTGSWQ